MSKLTVIRSKLDKKLFTTNVLGSTVTITPITVDEGDYGGYESQTETDGTDVSTVAVPYNLIYKELSYEPFGNLEEGSMDIVFKYDTTIDVNYKVTFNNVTYRVTKIEDISLNDGIAAKICRIVKEN